MILAKKVGVGIVTYNRPRQFTQLYDSLSLNVVIDAGIVVNDGDEIPFNKVGDWKFVQNERNLGVGKSKNIALQYLLDEGCDYIFLIEDDIYVKDPTVFSRYVEASQATGIQHFNYSQHGMMNKSWPGGEPAPRTTLNYDSANLCIPLYPHCVGAFSFYTRTCLEQVGLLDERYYNACEHVDHTLSIIKAGMHPPFWTFADIENSSNYLGDEEWSLDQSKISGKPGHDNIVSFADEVFKMKHGLTPGQIPAVPWEEVVVKIKEIKKNYAVSR
jgi:GT2 family glycosyltransferase